MSDWSPPPLEGDTKQKKKEKRVDAGYILSKEEEEETLGGRLRGEECEVDGACHHKK